MVFPIEEELNLLEEALKGSIDEDYLVSRGEYFTALLLSEYLGYPFVDAKDLIFFQYNGDLDYNKTLEAFEKTVQTHSLFVVPGFYGALPDGTIKLLSRGGSDITGSILANIANASVYENWTDVSGILKADPRIVQNPKKIPLITYSELRELSYMGANVLHEEAIFPVKDKNIPIHILNTNKPESTGTVIVNRIENGEEKKGAITGIAGKKDFTIITIKKAHMSNEVGTIKGAIDILDHYLISIEHIPTGIDSFSLVVESAAIKPVIYEVLPKIKERCNADEITVIHEIALIATVSRFMKEKIGMSGRLFTALGKENINISLISQTSDEMNIIIGVNNQDYSRTIQAIYKEYEEEI